MKEKQYKPSPASYTLVLKEQPDFSFDKANKKACPNPSRLSISIINIFLKNFAEIFNMILLAYRGHPRKTEVG
ncbi:hypothetical protein QFZ72_000859 [Bacillus sp. V2I10]|nr:hypothetical protein [Bacillus sp. V2I10]